MNIGSYFLWSRDLPTSKNYTARMKQYKPYVLEASRVTPLLRYRQSYTTLAVWPHGGTMFAVAFYGFLRKVQCSANTVGQTLNAFTSSLNYEARDKTPVVTK